MMRSNPFIDFICSERWRYVEKDNNRLTRAVSHASRYYNYLSLILERYGDVDAACRDEHQRIDELCKAHPDGFRASELERSTKLRYQLVYEIESFYMIGKILLDRVADLVLLYFGDARGCSLRSHNQFLKCRDAYFQSHSIYPPAELLKAMDDLQVHVCDFRDKKITHQNNLRISLGITYPEGTGAFLNIGHQYPKYNDEPYQSLPLDVLIKDINAYINAILSLLIENREHTVLQRNKGK